MEHGLADADGFLMHYLPAGDPADPTVVPLHGVVDCASLSWSGVPDGLAEGRHVVAPDLAGYGELDRQDADYSIAWHVGLVGSFLDDLGIGSPSVVGHLVPVDSYGLERALPNGSHSWSVSRIPRLPVSGRRCWPAASGSRASLGGIVVDPDAVPDEVVAELHDRVGRPEAGRAFRRRRLAGVTRGGYRPSLST